MRWTLSAGAALLLGAAPVLANDSVLELQKSDPNQWVHAARQLLRSALFRARPDQQGERRRPAGGLDVLDRRAARPRGLAAGHRQHDVRAHAVPEHRLCPRPRRRTAGSSGSTRRSQDPNVIGVMCCDTVYRGLAYADDTIFLHQADTTLVALDAKTGEVKWSVKNGDPAKARDQHRDGAAGQGQGDRRHLGRRVRRARPRHRLQHRRRLAGVARLLDRAGRGDAGRSGGDHRRSASRSAPTRRSTAGKATSGRSAAARPGAGTATIPSSTSSTTAPATPAPGTRRSGRATTSTR